MGGPNVKENVVLLCLSHHRLSENSAHRSELWLRYWMLWSEMMYEDYWYKFNEKQQYNNNLTEGVSG